LPAKVEWISDAYTILLRKDFSEVIPQSRGRTWWCSQIPIIREKNKSMQKMVKKCEKICARIHLGSLLFADQHSERRSKKLNNGTVWNLIS